MSKENQINRASFFYSPNSSPESSPEINEYSNDIGEILYLSDEEMQDSSSIEEMSELILPSAVIPVLRNVNNVPDKFLSDSDNNKIGYARPGR